MDAQKVLVKVPKGWGACAVLLGGDERRATPTSDERPQRVTGSTPARSDRHPDRGSRSRAALAVMSVDNARVSLTCAPAGAALFSTVDPSDRAHRIAVGGFLVPGSHAPGAVPRRYPACNMVGREGRQVEFGTVYEETDARARRLARELGTRVERGAAGETFGGGRALERYERQHGKGSARRISRWEGLDRGDAGW